MIIQNFIRNNLKINLLVQKIGADGDRTHVHLKIIKEFLHKLSSNLRTNVF